MTTFLNITPDKQHLLDEHKDSATALDQALAAAELHLSRHGSRSEDLDAQVLRANERHMNAHEAMMNVGKAL